MDTSKLLAYKGHHFINRFKFGNCYQPERFRTTKLLTFNEYMTASEETKGLYRALVQSDIATLENMKFGEV